MKHGFLADENVPRACIAALREQGLDVVWVSESSASISDTEVCGVAQSENRIILTNDKDFGDLVMRFRMKVPGVILLRLKGLSPVEMVDVVVSALAQNHDWPHHFSVITRDAIRMRPLLKPSEELPDE